MQELKETKTKDERENFWGVAKARPHQNPRGEMLTPVLLQQGLVLSPPSLGQLNKTASSNEAQNQDKKA